MLAARLLASSPAAWAPMPSATRNRWPRCWKLSWLLAITTALASWLLARRSPMSLMATHSRQCCQLAESWSMLPVRGRLGRGAAYHHGRVWQGRAASL
jgi:hypothetical protein